MCGCVHACACVCTRPCVHCSPPKLSPSWEGHLLPLLSPWSPTQGPAVDPHSVKVALGVSLWLCGQGGVSPLARTLQSRPCDCRTTGSPSAVPRYPPQHTDPTCPGAGTQHTTTSSELCRALNGFIDSVNRRGRPGLEALLRSSYADFRAEEGAWETSHVPLLAPDSGQLPFSDPGAQPTGDVATVQVFSHEVTR